MLELLMANWQIAVVSLLALYIVAPQVKTLLSKIKLPKLGGNKVVVDTNDNVNDVMFEDLRAIKYLTNRALDVGNTQLVQELKSVDAKFFDIHCNSMSKPVNVAGK